MADERKVLEGTTPEQVREGEALLALFHSPGGKIIRKRFEDQIAQALYRLVTEDMTEQQILMTRHEVIAIGRALESMGDDMTTAMSVASVRVGKQVTREALRR